MASIPANVILVHIGSNATIPSGWSRETTLDAKFPKGAAASTQGGTNGGATTHTHTSPNHSHTMTSHTHTYTTPISAETQGIDPNFAQGCSTAHLHTGTSGAVSGGSTDNIAVTYGAVSNEPPYRKVIFIKASVGAQLATDIVAFFNSNTPPSNWSNVTELSGRFMQGAGTGADADLTTDNGSVTNVHNIDHTHTTTAHSHVAATSGNSGATNTGKNDGGALTVAATGHTHSVALGSTTSTLSNSAVNLTTVETVQPVYAILQAIKKGATGIKVKGIIGLWLEAIALIPKGWVLADGTNSTKDMRDKHLRIGDPAGANGGSNTHTHASQSHTGLTGQSHTHTVPAISHIAAISSGASSTTYGVKPTDLHAATTSAAQTSAYDVANTTANSSNNEPEYRTVNFIEFQKEIISNGAFLLN